MKCVRRAAAIIYTEQMYFEKTEQKRLFKRVKQKNGAEISSSYFVLKLKHSYL